MKFQSTYWALQNLGDPLLLLHHVEILSQVRWHVPAAEVLRVTIIHSVKVALLGVAAGQGQGQRPCSLPHIHQTHVVSARSSTGPLESAREHKTSQLISHSGCQGNSFNRKKSCMCAMVTHVITRMETKESRTLLNDWHCFVSASLVTYRKD